MPPPMVPAPTMPTRRTGAPLTSDGSPGILAAARSAKNTCSSALAGSARTASRKSAGFDRAPLGEGQPGGGVNRLDGVQRRRLVRLDLARERTGGVEQRRVGGRRAELVVARTRLRVRSAGGDRALGERHRAGEQIAVQHGVEDPVLVRLDRRQRLRRHHHVERFRHAGETRQPLRALGAGNDPERTFGQANLGAGDGHAVVGGHGQLQAAAKGGAVDRHHDRLGAVFNAREEIVQIGFRRIGIPGQWFQGARCPLRQ